MGVDYFEDVIFLLYTRNNDENPEQLWIDNVSSIRNSSYDYKKSLTFLTHGWQSSAQGINCTTARRDENDCNVIVVDWSGIAKLPYLKAAGRIKVIGGYVAKMINFLESQGTDPKNISLVGHSLGAPLMGLAGYQTINKVGHIVALNSCKPKLEIAATPTGRLSQDVCSSEIRNTNYYNFGVTEAGGQVKACGNNPKQLKCKNENFSADDETETVLWTKDFSESLYHTKVFEKSDHIDETAKHVANSEAYRNIALGLRFLRTGGKIPFGLEFHGFRTTNPAA